MTCHYDLGLLNRQDSPRTDTAAMDDRFTHDEFKHLLADLYFRLEERDRWIDHCIRYLLTGNGGGVALLMTLLGTLGRSGRWQPWLVAPLGFFLGGVIAVGVVVGYSTHCAKQGRHGLIELIQHYLDGTYSYETVFRRLPKFPSKWAGFEIGCIISFCLFVAGVTTSGGLYAFGGTGLIAAAQPSCSCVLATPALGRLKAETAGAKATKPPPDALDRSSSPATHHK